MRKTRTDAREILLLSIAAGFGLLLNRWAQVGAAGTAHWTLDVAILTLAGGGALFGMALLAGHFALARSAISSASAYGAVGAIAALVAFFASGGLKSIELGHAQGVVTIVLGLPPLIGATLGMIYFRMASFVDGVTDPAAIETALAARSNEGGAPSSDGAHGSPSLPALIEVGSERYFSGPVCVRTSMWLLLASGAAVGGVIAVCGLVIGITASLVDPTNGSSYGLRGGLGLSALLIITLCLGLFVPNLVAHKIAQRFRVTSLGAYILTGFASCIAIGLIVTPFLLAALPSAFAMALYRRWAGLEPVPVPSEVIIGNERDLIAADHAARRYHKVVRA